MKASCLAFLMIAGVAWMAATSYASPSNPTSQPASSATRANNGTDRSHHSESADKADVGNHQSQGKPFKQLQSGGHVSEVNHWRSRANTMKANNPNQHANNRVLSTSGNASDLRRASPNRVSAAPRTGSILNPHANDRLLPARQPTVMRLGPSSNNVRHGGFNPPVISGLTNSGAGNTGAINGTHMRRRP